ncbi:hypothetical protein [Nocardia australiensis]|uniref:hypothetical protein n=1 Tax=Nocardia australiensis TaxID=2887191 RepID=UPI001D14660B|nr:hypothetical protein [Nocardia australiensis]
MRAKPTALGYLRKDISGVSLEWDEIQIRSIAKRLGYELPKTVVFSAVTDHPADRLMNVVRHTDADAVITPSLAHFGAAVPDALVRMCDLITVDPESTFARKARF